MGGHRDGPRAAVPQGEGILVDFGIKSQTNDLEKLGEQRFSSGAAVGRNGCVISHQD